MASLPWHVGYFADEGEMYEWEEDEGDDQDDDDDEDPGPKWDFKDFRKDKPAWPFKTKARVTSIAATPYGLGVIASLIADMQRQLGHLPTSFDEGLKPIYAPEFVPGLLLSQVVASSEDQITQLQSAQNSRSRKPLPQSESPRGLTQTVFSVAWAHKTEIVVATVAGGALLYLFPAVAGGAARVAPVLIRASPVLIALYAKVAQNAKAEAAFKYKVDNFDHLGLEVSEIGVV